jgi:hypothetical protein
MTDYVFRHEPQSAPRITAVEVPKAFAQALDAQWKIVQRDQVNPVVDFATAKEAAFHLAYAKQWGRDQKPVVVTVRKGATKAGDQAGTLRLIMTPFDENAPKRGRKPAEKENAATPATA